MADSNSDEDKKHASSSDGDAGKGSDRKNSGEDAKEHDDHDNDASDDDGSDEDEEDDGEDEDKEKKPSLFSKPLFWIILVVVVAAAVIGGTLYYLHARQFESTDDAFVDAHIVRLAPEVAGRVVSVANVDNRHVAAGELLAVLEPNGRDAQLGEAQANVKQALAQYNQAVAQVDAAEAAAAQAEAQSKAPLADAEKARADLARYEALRRLDASAVAGQQVDQARANARSTAAQAAAARQNVENALAQIVVAERAARAAGATIEARRAQVQQASTTINDLRVTAPVAGQVTNRQVNVGSYVAPGTQIMAIVPDDMWITANFKETQITLMRIGQPVDIHVDAFPDVTFHGHIDSFQRAAGQAFAVLPPQNATGNYVKVVQRVPVRIVFDRGKDKDGHDYPDPRRYPIGPGMSVVPTVKVR